MLKRVMASGIVFMSIFAPVVVSAAAAEGGDSFLSASDIAADASRLDNKQLQQQAIELARAGKMSQAIIFLRELTNRPGIEESVWYDYMTVLQWSGSNRTMLDLFQQRYKGKESTLPAYLLRSAGGANYQLEQFDDSLRFYSLAVAKGDAASKIYQAEAAMRSGDFILGEKLYASLLKERPNDMEIYLSRSAMAIYRKDFLQADSDYEIALSLLAADKDPAARRRLIDSNRAAIFIRTDELLQAIRLLQPYMAAGSTDRLMQCDYVLALRLRGDYAKAVQEARRLWPDLRDVPAYGLQALADAHLRLRQYEQADAVYSVLLEREPSRIAATLGKGYALLARGEVKEGLPYYRTAFEQDRSVGSIITADASSFFDLGRFAPGKALYKLLMELEPNKNAVYREYANNLQENSMPRAAHSIYRRLAEQPEGELFGLAGLVRAAVQAGDYEAAQRAVTTLQEKYARNSLTADAVRAYERRFKGSATTGFSALSDYKGNDVTGWDHSGSQSLGSSNWSVLWSAEKNRIADNEDVVRLNAAGGGVQYRSLWWASRLWLTDYRGEGSSFAGGRWDVDINLRDYTQLRFSVGRRPIQDVQAWRNEQIASLFRTISLTHQVGNKDFYDISYAWESYTDANHYRSLSGNYTHNIYTRDKKQLDWFLFAGRGRYANASDLYESPAARISYGAGIVQRWGIPAGYWELTTATEWGYDKPEPTDFAPYARLEYGHDFSPRHTLVAGVEYGGRTNRLNGRNGLLYGYRQFDIRYNIWW